MATHQCLRLLWEVGGGVPDSDRILGRPFLGLSLEARGKPRDGLRPITPTYLLPLFSSHLPFLLFIGLVPYKYLLDTFWSY